MRRGCSPAVLAGQWCAHLNNTALQSPIMSSLNLSMPSGETGCSLNCGTTVIRSMSHAMTSWCASLPVTTLIAWRATTSSMQCQSNIVSLQHSQPSINAVRSTTSTIVCRSQPPHTYVVGQSNCGDLRAIPGSWKQLLVSARVLLSIWRSSLRNCRRFLVPMGTMK